MAVLGIRASLFVGLLEVAAPITSYRLLEAGRAPIVVDRNGVKTEGAYPLYDFLSRVPLPRVDEVTDLQVLQQRMTLVYFEREYYDVKTTVANEAGRVTVRVDPGVHYAVPTVEIVGAKRVPAAKIIAAIGELQLVSGPGDPSRPIELAPAAREQIMQLYADVGRWMPELTSRLDRNPTARTSKLVITLREGEVFVVGKVTLPPELSASERAAVTKLLRVKTGDVADYWRLDADAARIRLFDGDRGHWRDVRVAHQIDGNARRVDVEYRLGAKDAK